MNSIITSFLLICFVYFSPNYDVRAYSSDPEKFISEIKNSSKASPKNDNTKQNKSSIFFKTCPKKILICR